MSVDRGRVRATWLLAESLLDYLPQARQPSSTLEALPGLAASRFVPCTACGARGRLRGPGVLCASCQPMMKPDRAPKQPDNARALHGCYACPVCEGSGWRRRRQSDPDIDGYAGVEVPSVDRPEDVSVGAIRRAIAAERERPEIREAALARATRIVDQAERPESQSFAWEESWERMCAHGSYRELVAALEHMRDVEEERYRVVWRHICLQQQVELSERRLVFLNESMTVLTSFMPERIRVPFWMRESKRNKDAKESRWRGRSPAHARERKERDAEVCRLRFDEDWSTGRLTRHFALSKSQINRILAEGAERSQT